jgi:hypothetical protein
MRKFKKESQTIAVAGCLDRIGTTTQAIQIVKYLNLMGYNACYIEVNQNGYVDRVLQSYKNIKEDKKTKRIVCDNVDMYRQTNIALVNKMDYEFLIKDYGAVTQSSFERISYLEQDFRIICGGIKPNEFDKVYDVLIDDTYTASGYIFSFVPNSNRSATLGFMEEKANSTFFADYVPDAFTYSATANNIYRTLLKL